MNYYRLNMEFYNEHLFTYKKEKEEKCLSSCILLELSENYFMPRKCVESVAVISIKEIFRHWSNHPLDIWTWGSGCEKNGSITSFLTSNTISIHPAVEVFSVRVPRNFRTSSRIKVTKAEGTRFCVLWPAQTTHRHTCTGDHTTDWTRVTLAWEK